METNRKNPKMIKSSIIVERYLSALTPMSLQDFMKKHVQVRNTHPDADDYLAPQDATQLYKQYKRKIRKNDSGTLHSYHGKK